jgi:Fe-S oxidoreductase
LLNFFPDHPAAARLSKQAVLFSDFLLTREQWQPRALQVKAIVHGHCHQKSLFGMTGESRLLKKLGVDFKMLDSGCCGMAGSFGFKPEHYEVSISAGEKGGLLPAVRAADADTLIITNGYSCREQIAQTGDRRALHIAEVARMALNKKD